MNTKQKISALGTTVVLVLVLAGLSSSAQAFEDSTPPEVTALSVTPTEFDTSESNQSITVTLTVTDSGIGTCPTQENNDCEGDYSLNKSSIQVDIKPLIGTQYILAFASDFTRISGDEYSGVYQATKTIPYGSKVGVWAVTGIYLSDKLGNIKWWSNSSTPGVPNVNTIPNASGLTIANTATSSSVTIQKEWTFSSSSASVTFPENTIVTKQEGGSFAFYQMVNQSFEITDVTTSGIADGSVVAGKVKMGIPGLNLSFDKPVTVTFTVDGKYNGKTLNIEGLTEGAASWANETTCVVSSGTCSFTVSHASYFMAVAHGSGTGVTDDSIGVSSSTVNLRYSTKKTAKKKITFTLTGVRIAKKNHVSVRLGSKKVKVVSVRKSAANTRIGISFKYRKWARGDYSISLSYKVKQNKSWSRGSYSQSSFMSIY